MTKATKLPECIGLALSGGGYRAAAFHLGTVEYLHAIGLGPSIKRMSTVSGGTIFGAAWTVALMEGRDFPDFVTGFRRFLLDVDLVKRGLKSLSGRAPKTPSKRHSLIAGMAGIYAQELVRDTAGRPYLLGDVFDARIQLEDVIFNATEFRYGLAFRFQRSASGDALIGNGSVAVDRTAARSIRLADVVAASSCFPGGFEPLAFPHDFAWPDGRIPAPIAAQFTTDGKPAPLALMDGGICDNQGIESLLLAGTRTKRPADLFVISDVSADPLDLWPYPDEAARRKGLRLSTVRWVWIALALACVISFVALGSLAWGGWAERGFDWRDLFTFVVPIALSGVVGFGLWWCYRVVRDEGLTKVPKLGDRSWRLIKDIAVRQLVGMIALRVGSVLCLTTDVFMARIRRLGFTLVYDDPKYREERVSNLIYELTPGRDWARVLMDLGVEPPSAPMQALAKEASAMPTTLWFDSQRQLDVVAATGRMTIAVNLMKWIGRQFGTDPAKYPADVRALFERLLADWRRWRTEPDPASRG
ncbi:MAG: patatin-like phospholipase family protein [Planctomycetes bacterium]|nr:patatin-like phospholipase family protein [Planctomycetota bacterium]